jgi:hypothetical protein
MRRFTPARVFNAAEVRKPSAGRSKCNKVSVRRRSTRTRYSVEDLGPQPVQDREATRHRPGVGQTAQNWNGATETDILPSDNCWTVKLTSFEAFVSPTVTDIGPLHFSVRLSSLVDVVSICSPRIYNGCCFDFSASELALLDFDKFELLAAYLISALLWSSETVWSTAFRVSKESHSGPASQPLRKIRKGKLQKTIGRIDSTCPALKPHRATDSKKDCSKWRMFTAGGLFLQ